MARNNLDEFYKDSPLRASHEDYLKWDEMAVLDPSVLQSLLDRDIRTVSKEEQELFEKAFYENSLKKD